MGKTPGKKGVIKIYEDQIEGRNPVLEALKSGRPINKIYIKKADHHGSLGKIIQTAKEQKIPVRELDPKGFDEMAKTQGHQGVIAAIAPRDYSTVEDILEQAESLGEAPFLIVVNELTDPQNLGSILRTADGFGAHGVIIPLHRSCGITPAVSKVSAGAAEYMKVARVTNIAQTLERLKENGLWIMGADSEGKDYYETDLTGPIALVIGGEDKGLGKLVKDRCDLLVRIPMKGRISSLNAAVAAAILGYDVLRQRNKKNGPKQ